MSHKDLLLETKETIKQAMSRLSDMQARFPMDLTQNKEINDIKRLLDAKATEIRRVELGLDDESEPEAQPVKGKVAVQVRDAITKEVYFDFVEEVTDPNFDKIDRLATILSEQFVNSYVNVKWGDSFIALPPLNQTKDEQKVDQGTMLEEAYFSKWYSGANV